ncbi:alpha-L-fucosidase [Maribacter vaceletii]|uniref:alpha-L-fucosidase n=1 Tax=Maribacter vaceletii TaxID=1206816 RepID=A0A495DTR3_9FLAO|nr:alpha-L-fucosidase [Maribacter vaceletii]RKR07970.1 alpha-L-fucosidase [Maribacter vaceletii]
MKKIFVIILLFALQVNSQELKFDSSWKSLEQYQCPEWFQDAKFGIWTCWNPYAVTGAGDWYARNMYIEGSRQYKFHLEHYGHPSEVGYKDIVEMWKGKKFDPEYMVDLFKEAGAKYVVAMAMHHDNFDLWDSKYHEWNSVNHGPHQNIIGKWEAAVRKSGLRWGVTSHLERSWNWFGVNKDADKEGPYAGIPYDGNNPKYSGLYFKKYKGYHDTNPMFSVNPPQEVIEDYFLREKDLLDQHKPDLFYFDGGIPFGETGRKLMAYYYNQNIKDNNGKLEAVMNVKNTATKWPFLGDQIRNGIAVEDVEVHQLSSINALPWQTDTSIADWFWTTDIEYKTPKYVVHQLIDIVSKNGNLLLNVPPRADGTLDSEAITLLKKVGKWLDVNGEGIYGSRPYAFFGEGPGSKAKAEKHFGMKELSSDDYRFTTKGDTIYAFVCGTTKTDININAFSSTLYHKIKSVQMLGVKGEIEFIQEKEKLVVKLPQKLPSEYAVCLKIIPELNPVPESISKY